VNEAKTKKDQVVGGIHEVQVLFYFVDYLTLPELIHLSQVSRGLYWLTGTQQILAKFHNPSSVPRPMKKLEDKNTNPDAPRFAFKFPPHLIRRRQRGLHSNDFQRYRSYMNRQFMRVYNGKFKELSAPPKNNN
jgi:hypothetical protein